LALSNIQKIKYGDKEKGSLLTTNQKTSKKSKSNYLKLETLMIKKKKEKKILSVLFSIKKRKAPRNKSKLN